MHSVPKKIMLGSLFAALLLCSGWLGYKNLGIIPTQTELDYEYERFFTNRSEVSLTDISSDSSSQPVSSTPTDSSAKPPEYTEETIRKKYVRINKATNMRTDESDSSKLVSVLTEGDEVEYISESNIRFQVRNTGGKTGWIRKTCGDLFEKEVIIRHAPVYTSGQPIPVNTTQEGDGIAELLRNHSAVGASVAVIKNGNVAYTYDYGYASKKKNSRVSTDTKFRIASVTKVFTSMLAMTEVDDGKLDLDGDLSQIMGYKFYHPYHPDQKVTTRMLLTHTSGLIDRDNEFSMPLKSITCNSDFYVSPPDVKFLYCNLNIAIAGAVVEKAADQTISQYAKNRFFDPMGIDASFDAKYLKDPSLVADCYSAGSVSQESKYLCRSQERGKPGVTFHLGQGGLLISAADMARVFTVLMNDGQYDGRQYISQASLKEMLSPSEIDTNKGFTQCIGIRKSDKLVKNREMYFHNGAAYGIYSLMAFDPADKSGIVIITSGAYTARNKNTVFAVCDEVMNYCYDTFIR